jgi:DNA-binding MarR family transcriptional regulator
VTGDTRWLDDDEQRTWRAFLTAERLLFDRLERQLQRDAGMPMTYYEILVQLSEAPDRTLRMSQLAESSLSSRSRLSHAVARLEAAGWIRRRACAEDRRGSFAELTDDGLAKLDEAARGHVEAVRSNLFDLLTPAQQNALREISQVVVGHLSTTPVWPADGCPDADAG